MMYKVSFAFWKVKAADNMNRDYRLDVIRAAAILMIFTFHFCCTIGSTGIFYGYVKRLLCFCRMEKKLER